MSDSSKALAIVVFELLPGVFFVAMIVLGLKCRSKMRSELQTSLLLYVPAVSWRVVFEYAWTCVHSRPTCDGNLVTCSGETVEHRVDAATRYHSIHLLAIPSILEGWR